MRAMICLSLVLISWIGHAQQDSSGVFVSAGDFQRGRMIYAINCTTQRHKISRTSFSDQKYIRIVHNDSIKSLLKSEVFGYKDCKGMSYRFIGGVSYAILNPSEYILIYKHEIRTHKRTGLHYMFSRGVTDPVRLTKENLKNAFSDQPDFQKKIDQVFKRDGDLPRYDKATGETVLNWLYNRTKT